MEVIGIALFVPFKNSTPVFNLSVLANVFLYLADAATTNYTIISGLINRRFR